MKIAILGAGATGCNVGGHLKLAGEEVYLVDPFQAHMDAIREKGLVWHENDGTIHEPIFFDGATNDAKEIGECDVVILQTKCPYSKSAIEGHMELFGENTTVITLQNGMGATEILQEYFPAERIGYGILYSGGAIIEPGHTIMYHTDRNILFRRMAGGKNDVFTHLENAFNQSDFPVEYCEEIDKIIWTKLGVNCMCNMPCGIARLDIKALYTHEDGYDLTAEIAKEVAAVANALGIPVDVAEIMANRDTVRAGQYTGYPSGTQDIMNKKQTEVDFLNGAVARIGKRVGVPTPVNATIAQLARILQGTYAQQF